MPSHLAVGSVTGLAVVLSEFTALEVSLITLVLNVALLIAGLILIGRDFGFKTIYTSLLLPLTLAGSLYLWHEYQKASMHYVGKGGRQISW